MTAEDGLLDRVSDHRIELHLDITRPVELTDLTMSFLALGREYRRHLVQKVRESGGTIKDAEIKLYVTRLETGSIWAEIAGATQVLGAILPMMDYQVIFADYLRYLRSVADYFRAIGRTGKVEPADIPYNKAQCDAISDIFKTVSENKDGNLNLSAIEYQATETAKTKKTNLQVSFAADEAMEIRRGALIAKQALDYRGNAQHPNVLMYYYQTNIDEPKSEGRTADRVVIRSVSEQALPVHFLSEIDRQRIQDRWGEVDFNPFKASYRVDVNVEEDRNGRPKYYRVLRLHEIIPDVAEDE